MDVGSDSPIGLVMFQWDIRSLIQCLMVEERLRGKCHGDRLVNGKRLHSERLFSCL